MIALATRENLLLAYYFYLTNDIEVALCKSIVGRNFQGISFDLETLQRLEEEIKKGIQQGIETAMEDNTYVYQYSAKQYFIDLLAYGYDVIECHHIMVKHYDYREVSQLIQGHFYTIPE